MTGSENMINITEDIIKRSGIFQYGYIKPDIIEFREDIQAICRNNSCRVYGKTWACPPAIGNVDECRQRCNSFDNVFVFSGKYDLEDSFDFEGMEAAGEEFRRSCEKLFDAVDGVKNGCMILANGGCRRCSECTYPDSPCRFPEKLFMAFEGHGIIISDVAKAAGINYINGKDTVTYHGALFYNLK